MEIDSKLIEPLQKIDFSNRYKRLCRNCSDFDSRLTKFDKNIIVQFAEEKGFKTKYDKTENFNRIDLKINNLSLQFNIIPHNGFIQFVLDIKEGEQSLNLGFGMWESITDNLDMIDGFKDEYTRKPIFNTQIELRFILTEIFDILNDFLNELGKIK